VTRKQRHCRLSHLFTIDSHIPKLDAEGSNPFSRSILSITYARLTFCKNPLSEVTGYADAQNPLKGIGFND
jgi:hypothetical protein